jgi:hypothetical protein
MGAITIPDTTALDKTVTVEKAPNIQNRTREEEL